LRASCFIAQRDEVPVETGHTALGDTVSVGSNELPASLSQRALDACAAPIIIFESSASGCLVRYVNLAFARRTGYSAAEIAQTGWDGLHVDGERGSGMAPLCAAVRERRDHEVALRIHGKDGVTFRAALHVSPVGEPGASTPSYAVGVLREETANAEYVSRLERDAHYDPLTGLPNRRLLAERAERALKRARRENQPLGVALVDLDDFKRVNDMFGHAAGDEVLCATAARLARDLRAGDFVARVGGDEFVLLLHETSGDFALASAIERVSRRIELPMHFHGRSINMTCSIGLAVCPTDGADLNTLLEHADSAMYRQKARRRSTRVAERPALYTA
jgi:diguanylate cyclase (GGDEF)-like protein/PAS domain S-box-containing protein